MQLITAHAGQIQALSGQSLQTGLEQTFTTGLPALDALAPGGALARGAVHEVLSEGSQARFVAALMAGGGCGFRIGREGASCQLPVAGNPQSEMRNPKSLAWCDPDHTLYPPALASLGIPLERVILLHPRTAADALWAVTECLRCRGVGATVAAFERLTRVEARRLQLAAERGSGVGILMRRADRSADVYAAATRWLVRPAPGEPTVQRWSVELVHGHGGRVGQGVFLEWDRETYTVRATDRLADRSNQAEERKAIRRRA